MTMCLSAAFAPTLDTPDHVAIAEELGYQRAWLYDTPQQGSDVWLTLALAARQTSRIGLGPGVLVPSLRHPMVNAAGAAALEKLAPGRVVVAFGTGYTGRRAMGQPKPITWAEMVRYITTFQGLLRGETVEWEGGAMRMLHPDSSIPGFPIEIPVYVSAVGPKGLATAQQVASRLFIFGDVPAQAANFESIAYLAYGTVLETGETSSDERVRVAGGPALVQLLHGAYEFSGEGSLSHLPGGSEWLQVVMQSPENERHLAVHRGHCLYLNEADTAAWNAGAHVLLTELTLAGTAEQVRAKADALAEQGVTELVYQPIGDDIARELTTMASALGLG